MLGFERRENKAHNVQLEPQLTWETWTKCSSFLSDGASYGLAVMIATIGFNLLQNKLFKTDSVGKRDR
jgi:hypothetical protein